MSSDTSRFVGKLWSYCNVFRDDGLSYGGDRAPAPDLTELRRSLRTPGSAE